MEKNVCVTFRGQEPRGTSAIYCETKGKHQLLTGHSGTFTLLMSYHHSSADVSQNGVREREKNTHYLFESFSLSVAPQNSEIASIKVPKLN